MIRHTSPKPTNPDAQVLLPKWKSLSTRVHPSDLIAHRKSFRIRSAYRHEADFTANQFGHQTPFLEDPGLRKLIQAEQTVRKNYERLASQLLQGVFDPSNDDKRVAQLREEHIGRTQRTLKRVFGDLTLRSPGDIIEDGTFFFDKGGQALAVDAL